MKMIAYCGLDCEKCDADMRQYITMKLIESLPQFPLEELEMQNCK